VTWGEKEMPIKKFLRPYFLVAYIAALFPVSALAYEFTVPTGMARQVWYSFTMNQDCSLEGEDVIRVTTAPTHGRVTFKKGLVHPNFPASNPRNVCNTRAVRAPTVWYTPEPGYVGDDWMTVEVISASGSSKTETINIHVK